MTTHGRAKAYRQKQTAEVALPSGATFTLRRPPIQAWLSNGRAPQFLTKIAIDAQSQNLANGEQVRAAVGYGMSHLTEDEVKALLKFQADVVAYSMVWPRLVVPKGDEPEPDIDTLGDDEMLASELLIEDFNAIVQYAMNGSTGVPVATKNGDVTLDSVANFRDGAEGRVPADAGADVPADGREAEQSLRTVG